MAKNQIISVTAVPGQRISVGVNYPWAWNKIGCYFGNGETTPGDSPAYDVWLSNLDRNLGTLDSVGVSVVRIFLFGNAHNLGGIAPGLGPIIPSTIPDEPGDPPPQQYSPWWSFVKPASVSPIYTDQLDRMLKIFNKHEMKVIPSLLSFEAVAQSLSGVGCGKTDIVVDGAMRSWFLSNIVDPFLQTSASGDNAKAVFAC